MIASGDLTNRGRRDQHERAAAFLKRLGLPVVAIPGNHDIPYTFPARFTSTWSEFERQWQTTEPEYISPGAHIVGLNSVRPWRHQSGGVSDAQLERATAKLHRSSNDHGSSDKLRVVALHHQMVGAPWRTRKKPVARRTQCWRARRLRRRADRRRAHPPGSRLGAARVRGDHRRRTRRGRVDRAGPRPAAPGAARRSARLRRLPRGRRTLSVDTYIWREDDWGLTAVRTFPRGRQPLAVDVP